MFDCKIVDERFVESAKARGTAERTMNVSAGQLFAALEDGPSWSKWVPVIKSVEWTSPLPFTKGTTRTVGLVGGIRLDEVFWAWEDERRIGFCVTKTNSRTLGALAECYDITPLDAGRCKLRWRMAMELRDPLRMIEKYMRPSLGPSMEKMLVKLEQVATRFAPTQPPRPNTRAAGSQAS